MKVPIHVSPEAESTAVKTKKVNSRAGRAASRRKKTTCKSPSAQPNSRVATSTSNKKKAARRVRSSSTKAILSPIRNCDLPPRKRFLGCLISAFENEMATSNSEAADGKIKPSADTSTELASIKTEYGSDARESRRNKDSPQRAKHNRNNRSRLRAISDRINQLRELLEENDLRVGPSKLEILTTCSRHFQTIQLLPAQPVAYPRGFASSLYTQIFESSEEPRLMVEIPRPNATSIVNVNDKLLNLTGWTRPQLLAKPYSSIVTEPRAWRAHYRSLADDDRVLALHMSNVSVASADGSKTCVNVHVRSLCDCLQAVTTSLTVCIAIVSVGDKSKAPRIRVQYRGDASFGKQIESQK